MAKQSKYIILIALISLLFVACNSKKSDNILRLSSDFEIDTLFVNRPTGFTYSSMPRWQTKVFNDTSYLIMSSDTGESIQLLILNGSTMEYQKIITIPREGPNGYKTNSPSFYWNNPDSIFIFPTSLNKAFLYNKDIQIIKTYEYIAEFTMSFDSNEQQQGGALVKNDLYINTIPYSNPNNPSFTSSTYVSHSLNLDYSELTPFSGYPNKFNNKIIPTSFLGGQIIRAFDSILFINNYYSDEINVYNLLSKRSSTTSLGMTELNHLEGLDQAIDNRGLEIIGIQLKYPNYYNIWYDPYRKQVYRYSRHINPKYDSYSSGQVLKEMERNNTRLLQNTLISLSENGKKQYYNLPFNIEFGFPTKHGFVIKSSKLEDDNHDVYLRLILEQ